MGYNRSDMIHPRKANLRQTFYGGNDPSVRSVTPSSTIKK